MEVERLDTRAATAAPRAVYAAGAALLAVLTPSPSLAQHPPHRPPAGLSVPIAQPPAPLPAETERGGAEMSMVDYPTPELSVRHGLTLLPLRSRTNIVPFVGQQVPGVEAEGEGLMIQGGAPRETQLMLDGLRVRRLPVPLASMEELEISTAGYDVHHADVTGGLVSLSSARPDQRLRLQLDSSAEGGWPGWQRLGARVSTPLPRSLWMMGAVEVSRARVNGASTPLGFVPTYPEVRMRTGSALGKLAWRPSDRHSLELLTAGALGRQDNVESLSHGPDSQPRFDDRWLLGSLRWRGQLHPRLQATAQLGLEHDRQQERPQQCPAESCETPPMIYRLSGPAIMGNHLHLRARSRASLDLSAGVTTQLPSPDSRLAYALRLRPFLRRSTLTVSQRTPGDRLLEFVGAQPEAETIFFVSDPQLGSSVPGPHRLEASSQQLGASLEGPITLLSRFHLLPGVALIAARAQTGDGQQLADRSLAPGMRLTAQPLAGRDLWLRAASTRRVDLALDSVADGVRPGPISRRCGWNSTSQAYDRACFVSGATTTIGLPCGPAGLAADGSPCRGSAGAPRVWEHTLGLDVGVGGGLRLGADLVERRTRGGFRVAETNWIWNQSVVAGYRNGRPETVLDLSANPERRRRHRSITATVTERLRGLDLLAAYTWARTADTRPLARLITGPLGSASLLDAGEGHGTLHLRGILDLGHVSLGLLYRYVQGLAFRDWPGYQSPGASMGVDPGINLNDPGDDRTFHLRATQQIDLQLRLRGKRLTGLDVDLYLDGLELLEPEAPPSSTEGPTFISASAEIRRWWRLGVELRY